MRTSVAALLFSVEHYKLPGPRRWLSELDWGAVVAVHKSAKSPVCLKSYPKILSVEGGASYTQPTGNVGTVGMSPTLQGSAGTTVSIFLYTEVCSRYGKLAFVFGVERVSPNVYFCPQKATWLQK